MRILSAVVMLVLASGSVGAEPPFRDLPWIWPHILTSDDPSALREVVPNGKGKRRFWESWRWQEMNVWLFTARYRGGVEIEIQVSPEWRRRRVRAAQREWEPGSPPWESPEYDERTEKERMLTEVGYVADVLGRLPAPYRRRIEVATLDSGYEVASANRERKTVHFYSRFNDRMESFGSAEEYYLHEAGHLFDDEYLNTDCWRNAQRSDGEFISEYAAAVPDREDLAETFIAYFALRYHPDRMPPGVRRTIRETIPARIKCLDGWGLGAERP